MESYNRQLHRHTNVYSQLMARFMRNSEKKLELMQVAPKSHTVIGFWQDIVDFGAQIDKVAEVIQKMGASNKNRMQSFI